MSISVENGIDGIVHITAAAAGHALGPTAGVSDRLHGLTIMFYGFWGDLQASDKRPVELLKTWNGSAPICRGVLPPQHCFDDLAFRVQRQGETLRAECLQHRLDGKPSVGVRIVAGDDQHL